MEFSESSNCEGVDSSVDPISFFGGVHSVATILVEVEGQ